MKRYRNMKKSIIVLSAVLLTALTGCAKAEPSSESSLPDYTVITMEDLKAINGDDLEIEYNSYGKIESIEGEFAYFPITDKDKAYEAFLGVAELLGIENTDELVYDENASNEKPNGLNVYYFFQYHNGIRVYGAFVRIIVNPEHTDLVDLYNGYEPNLNIDTEPKISEKEAIERAESKYNAKVVGEPRLVISEKALAWEMDLSGSDTYRIIMRADNGAILNEENTIID